MTRRPERELVPELANEDHEISLLPGVHPRGRLVEEQDLRSRAQGPGDLQPPLLAVGKVARLLVCAVREAHHPRSASARRVISRSSSWNPG
jgi:hypothetical protein